MPDRVHVRRALLSVSDKTGLIDFARGLAALGIDLISTGGTAKALAEAGLRVTGIDAVTGFPEMMDGRVKTLHPKVHGGILAVRDDKDHVASMLEHGITPIDLVCINLYPFEKTVARAGVTREEAIENIDIGGPSMVRSAAKNHEYVTVVTDPTQYASVLAELQAQGAETSSTLRRRLARHAFAMTAKYDAAIAAYMERADESGETITWPPTITMGYELVQSLRYGENPHQAAAVYRDTSPDARGVLGILNAKQLHGKELSYNNVADAAAALDLAAALAEADAWRGAATCVIKHANPCGAAVAASVVTSVDRAIAGDPLAAFGGILASSAEIDEAAAARLTAKETFLEVIIAPSFSAVALEQLKARSVNVRLLAVGDLRLAAKQRRMIRSIPGGLLVQDRDLKPPTPSLWEHKAGPVPTPARLAQAAALEVVVRAISSNAIAVGGDEHDTLRLFGVGVGQVDRMTACKLAVDKAGALARGAIALSDAFFPFNDGPKLLVDAGVTMIVHPGGSKRDQETFDLCQQHGVTCMVTGTRRFRH